MATKLLIKRGTLANIGTLDAGRLYLATDTTDLYIGTAGGNQLIGKITNKANTFTGANTFSGITTLNGTKLNVRTVTDSTTIATTDDVLVCNKTTAMTVTLIAATGTEQRFFIKNIGAGDVTVSRAGSDLIDGETSQILATYDSLEIIDSASAVWSII